MSIGRGFFRAAVMERGVSVHLTQFSDYSLRLVLYLACHPEQVVSVDEMSRAFGISRHHLVKVVQTLTDLGVVEAQRGRGGGMRLAMRPSEINVGWLVRRTEPHFDLVECFDPGDQYVPDRPGLRVEGGALPRPAGVPGRARRVHPRRFPVAAARAGPPAGCVAAANDRDRRHRRVLTICIEQDLFDFRVLKRMIKITKVSRSVWWS